jgi:hypothetical protein
LAFSPPGEPRARHRYPSLIYSTAERRSRGAARTARCITATPFEAAPPTTFRKAGSMSARVSAGRARPAPRAHELGERFCQVPSRTNNFLQHAASPALVAANRLS